MIFLIFSFLQLANASLLKHEVTSHSLKEFEYAEVCETLGAKNSVLITPKNFSRLECLNMTFPISEFCLKKFKTTDNLVRGLIDPVKKKAVCEFSDSVMISVSCDDRDAHLCRDSKRGCEELKKSYALNLELAHFSTLDKNINCYFSKASGDTVNEL